MKRKSFNILCFTCMLVLFTSCYKEVDIQYFESESFLKFDEISCGIDTTGGIVLVPVKETLFPSFQPTIETNFTELSIGGEQYSSGDEVVFEKKKDSLSISFTTQRGSKYEGYIYFTTLPILQIECPQEIVDEPKTAGQLIVSDYSTYSTAIEEVFKFGVEIRGRSAATRPKKSYAFELWSNLAGDNMEEVSLLGMREDADWILDAMYIDKARMRNKLSMDLWRDICELSQSNNYHGKSYTESRFIELFINMEYKGLYNLTERFDRKQLNLKHSINSPEGLLYKTEVWTNTTKFIELADTNEIGYWDGWEQKYPDPSDYSYWSPVYDFADFVINSPESAFADEITDYLNLNNLMDYFIFINTCQATDNMGTNMYYARYDRNSTFTIYPWDLDASWGRTWDSTIVNHNWYLTNKYYDKLHNIDNYVEALEDKWVELRTELITNDGLISRFSINADIIKESGAYHREKARWPDSQLSIDSEIEYIRTWINNRVQFLDELFTDFEKNSLRAERHPKH